MNEDKRYQKDNEDAKKEIPIPGIELTNRICGCIWGQDERCSARTKAGGCVTYNRFYLNSIGERIQ